LPIGTQRGRTVGIKTFNITPRNWHAGSNFRRGARFGFFFFVCRAIISRSTTIIARDIFVRRVFYSAFWSSGAELGMVDREIDEHVDLLPQVWPADGHAVAER